MVWTENSTGRRQEEEKITLTKLAVLISNRGTGSNLQAIIDAIDSREINCSIGIVVSDRANAQGLERARRHGVPSEVLPYRAKKMTRDNYGEALGRLLNRNGAQTAVLAGFSTILPPTYFRNFRGVTINIHPGLIPDREDEIYHFPDGTPAPWNRGLMTEEAVKNFLGLQYAGSTWHIATEATDFGPVLQRVIVGVAPEDTVETLYSRLKRAEHKALIEILKNPPVGV